MEPGDEQEQRFNKIVMGKDVPGYKTPSQKDDDDKALDQLEEELAQDKDIDEQLAVIDVSMDHQKRMEEERKNQKVDLSKS